MSSWQDELNQILSKLNVQQEEHMAQQEERTQPEPATSTIEISLTQVSYGVFHRLDLVDGVPELRVYIPSDDGAYKMHIYLVKLAPQSFLTRSFELFMTYDGGSSAFHEIEGVVIYHLLLMTLNAMKELFWQGDPTSFHFPPEIEVRCLL